jgi:hypothetical protein
MHSAVRTCVTGCLVAVSLALPAQRYPAKPVRVIVPFPSGNTADILAHRQKIHSALWPNTAITDDEFSGRARKMRRAQLEVVQQPRDYFGDVLRNDYGKYRKARERHRVQTAVSRRQRISSQPSVISTQRSAVSGKHRDHADQSRRSAKGARVSLCT